MGWETTSQYGINAVVPGLPHLRPRDLEQAATMGFREKHTWFYEQIDKLRVPWANGHVRISVNRAGVLVESQQAVAKLKKKGWG